MALYPRPFSKRDARKSIPFSTIAVNLFMILDLQNTSHRERYTWYCLLVVARQEAIMISLAVSEISLLFT